MSDTPLSCQKHLFDFPEGLTYLNCANQSPLMNAAVEAGHESIGIKAHPWNIHTTNYFTDCERIRPLFGKLINASAENIAIIPATSYGIATAAANLSLRKGGNIIVLAEQFPSNFFSWREMAARDGGELRVIAFPEDGDWNRAILERMDDKTAILALPNCHWTDGSLIDLPALRAAIGKNGPKLVLDVTQSLGAVPLDVEAIDPDFLVCSAYKWLFCPYGLAFLYVADRHLGGHPLEHNWVNRSGAEDFSTLTDYREDFQPGARRFDTGQRSNFITLPMAIKALEQLVAWNPARTLAYIRNLTEMLVADAERLGAHVAEPHHRAGHMIGLRRPKPWPDSVRQALKDKNIHVSFRSTALRVSPHLYNTADDVERLLAALKA